MSTAPRELGPGAASVPPTGGDPTPARGGPGPLVWLVLLIGLGITGGALALYHRPGGRGFWAGTHPGRLGVHVELERLLAWGHRGLALALAFVLCLWLWRAFRGQGREPLVLPLGWSAVALAAFVSAFLVPWETYLPWAEASAVTDLPATRQNEGEGPFPELIGLRGHYPVSAGDAAWPPGLRSRRGLVLAWVHVLIGPLGMLAALFASRVQRSRQPRDGQSQGE